MKKALSAAFAFGLALLLSVTAFADIMPPIFFQVTVGDKPITRYSMEYTNDEQSALLEDGKIPAGETIDVSNVVTINGKKYGQYTTWNTVDEPVTNESGIRLNKWKAYYFLLVDVLSPEEAETANGYGGNDDIHLPVVTQTKPPTSAATTVTQVSPTTTQTTTETTRTTTEADPATTAIVTETETQVSETQTQPSEITEAESTTVFSGSADVVQSRHPAMRTLAVCITVAVILTLTAVVSLLLIRRKKKG